MTQLQLVTKSSALTDQEMRDIDHAIESLITQHKNNAGVISKLTLESITALTASEGRQKELARQGFWKRSWNNLTGKNQKLQSQIDADFSKVQYASQQMIQKLHEQNLFTFDLVTAVNNKLNMLAVDFDQEINRIYGILGQFFRQTRSDIVRLEGRVEKIERNVELLHWNATIEYQMYGGTEYANLPDMEKIICLTNDFFCKTSGNWNTGDLMLLKSTMSDLGVPVKSSLQASEFYRYLVDKPVLIEKLFEGINLDGLLNIHPTEAPLIKGVEKLDNLNNDERYLYETVVSHLENLRVPYDKRSIQLSMIQQYLLHSSYINIETEVNMFDFVVGLLVDLAMVNNSMELIFKEEAVEPEEVNFDVDNIYEVMLVNQGNSRVELIQFVAKQLHISLTEAKDLIENTPCVIKTGLSKEEADKLKKELWEFETIVVVKTIIESIDIIHAPHFGTCYTVEGDSPQLPLIFLGASMSKPTKKYVDVGSKILADTILCKIHLMPVGSNGTVVRAGVEGEVVAVLIENDEQVVENQPLFLVKHLSQ